MRNIFILSLFLPAFLMAQVGNDFKFEKIIFHTTECYGFCSVYHLEIDSNKNAKLFSETVYKSNGKGAYRKDSSKVGYFQGRIADTTFNKLVNEIQTIGIDSLTFDGANCCDAPIKTIIIYYNNKRKYLRSMFPPNKARRLVSLLYEICGVNGFRKINGKFEIEAEKESW